MSGTLTLETSFFQQTNKKINLKAITMKILQFCIANAIKNIGELKRFKEITNIDANASSTKFGPFIFPQLQFFGVITICFILGVIGKATIRQDL